MYICYEMKISLTILIILFSLSNTFGQFELSDDVGPTDYYDNEFYVQIFANAESIFSLNYARVLYSTENNRSELLARGGFSFFKARWDPSYHFTFPMEGIIRYNWKINFFEFGIGYTPTGNNSDLTSNGIPETETANYYFHYNLRFGYKLHWYAWDDGPMFIGISYLPTLRQKTPGSSTWITGNSWGFSIGIFFGMR
jgi:hypothetical protein